MPHEVSEEVFRRQPDNSFAVPTAKTEVGTSLRAYTNEDVELALRTLALNGGNYSRTAEIIKEQNELSIHPQTIKRWSTVLFTKRYMDIIEKVKDEIGERLAAKLSDLAIKSADMQEQVLEKLEEKIDDIPAKDLPGAARSLAQAGSMNTEKMQLLRGEATSRIDHMTPEEIVEELRDLDIDIPDADVIEEN